MVFSGTTPISAWRMSPTCSDPVKLVWKVIVDIFPKTHSSQKESSLFSWFSSIPSTAFVSTILRTVLLLRWAILVPDGDKFCWCGRSSSWCFKILPCDFDVIVRWSFSLTYHYLNSILHKGRRILGKMDINTVMCKQIISGAFWTCSQSCWYKNWGSYFDVKRQWLLS